MYQKFFIEMDDGRTFEIDSDARDIRAWEAEHEQSFFRVELSFTTYAQLAYLAGRRTAVLNGEWPDYQTFDAHCVAARGERPKVTIGNPTQPGVTADSSAKSRTSSARSRRK